MAIAMTRARREQSKVGLGTSTESVDEELARLDKVRVKAVFTNISREPVGIERAHNYPKLPTVLESPELSRALAIGQSETVNDVPIQNRACCTLQERSPSKKRRSVDAAPDLVGMAL